jgi:hypothetical protein
MTPSWWANTPISAIPPLGEAPVDGRRERRPAHGAAGLFRDDHHGHRLFGLVAIGGRFGDLIADIPFTVIVVLLASLVECFLILPNHMAHALAHSAKEHWYDMPSRVVNKGFEWVRERLFRPSWPGSSGRATRFWRDDPGAGQQAALFIGRRDLALLQRARDQLGFRQLRHATGPRAKTASR